MLGPQAPLEAPPGSALPPSSLWTAPCAHQSVSLQRMEGTTSFGKRQLWGLCALPCPSVDLGPRSLVIAGEALYCWLLSLGCPGHGG